MKVSLDQIKSVINKQKSFLESTYQVQNIGVFGSVATGQNTNDSDVDILVEFSKPIGFFKFIELEEFLTKIAGKRVDLVTKKALKPAVKEGILQEVIYV